MGFLQVGQNVLSHIGKSMVGIFLPDRPYWAVKVLGGRYLSPTFFCELDIIKDPSHPEGQRPFDWTLDLIATGDIKFVRELWLFCPPNALNPAGQSARLVAREPMTLFQMKIANVDTFGAIGRGMVSQVIGRVLDKQGGKTECFVWDTDLQVLGTWETNIYRMGSWRDEVAPITSLNHDILGLDLR